MRRKIVEVKRRENADNVHHLQVVEKKLYKPCERWNSHYGRKLMENSGDVLMQRKITR